MKKLYETPSNNRYERPMSGEEEKSEAAYGESTRHAAERELGYRRVGLNVMANNQMAIYNPSSTLYQSGILNADAVRGNLNAYLAPTEMELYRNSMNLANYILGPTRAVVDDFSEAFIRRNEFHEGERRTGLFVNNYLPVAMVSPPGSSKWPVKQFATFLEGADANHPDQGPGDRPFLKRNVRTAKRAEPNKEGLKFAIEEDKIGPSKQTRLANVADEMARPKRGRMTVDEMMPHINLFNQYSPELRKAMLRLTRSQSGENEGIADIFKNARKTRFSDKYDRLNRMARGIKPYDERNKSKVRSQKGRQADFSAMAKGLERLLEENTVYMKNGKLYRQPKGG